MPDRQTDRSLETPEADVADEYAPEEEPPTVPDEADAADVAEQHIRARGAAERWPDSVPTEANEADAADQHWSVRDEQDEDDDYR
jgi:hypothetical protein